MSCINDKKCHDNCNHCDEYNTLENALKTHLERYQRTVAYVQELELENLAPKRRIDELLQADWNRQEVEK